MLERSITTGGLVYYASKLLRAAGVRHAFSTRVGGVSEPPFDSLNLGNPSDGDARDDWDRIHANYRRLQRAIGWDGDERVWVHQVHGSDVAHLRRGEAFENGARADAIVGDDPHRLLAVRVADCVPILLSADDGRVVAAVHAGWRGVVAQVVPNAVNALVGRARTSPRSIVAAIGPCIGMAAFEVGGEVLDAFEQSFEADAPIEPRTDGKGHVDLRRAVQVQLQQAGLTRDRIDTTDRCTHRDRDEFFSHRRERGITGRMAAIIAPRPDPSTTP